jgi:hypothetical protein
MCRTADSLMVTQYVRYSRQFNADTICSDANDSVHNESATVEFSSAIYCLFVLTEQHSDRRNSKYTQQTETQTAVLTNHNLKRTNFWTIKGSATYDQNTNTIQENIQ